MRSKVYKNAGAALDGLLFNGMTIAAGLTRQIGRAGRGQVSQARAAIHQASTQ